MRRPIQLALVAVAIPLLGIATGVVAMKSLEACDRRQLAEQERLIQQIQRDVERLNRERGVSPPTAPMGDFWSPRERKQLKAQPPQSTPQPDDWKSR